MGNLLKRKILACAFLSLLHINSFGQAQRAFNNWISQSTPITLTGSPEATLTPGHVVQGLVEGYVLSADLEGRGYSFSHPTLGSTHRFGFLDNGNSISAAIAQGVDVRFNNVNSNLTASHQKLKAELDATKAALVEVTAALDAVSMRLKKLECEGVADRPACAESQ